MTEKRLHDRLAHLLRHPADPPMNQVFEIARPYFDTVIGTETLLAVATARCRPAPRRLA